MSTRTSRTTTVRSGTDTEQTTGRDGRPAGAAPTGRPHGLRPGAGAPKRHRRRLTRRMVLAATVAVIAVLGVVIAGVTATSEEDMSDGGNVRTIVEPAVGSQEYLDRLANQGYIPKEAVDQDLLRLEGLVGRGDVPPASLESGD